MLTLHWGIEIVIMLPELQDRSRIEFVERTTDMNCPRCNQLYAPDTFVCASCGCKVFNGKMVAKGEKVAEMPPQLKVTPHGLLSTWRLLQMMIGGTVVTGAGVGMILIDAWLYGIFLICVGIAVFAFGIWTTMKAR